MAEIRTIKLRRGTSTQWAAKNPVLASGEPGLELDSGRLKLGDGITTWDQLDYLVSSSTVRLIVADSLADVIQPEGGTALELLAQHIESATPHPVYDDGPSLRLLYENAKV